MLPVSCLIGIKLVAIRDGFGMVGAWVDSAPAATRPGVWWRGGRMAETSDIIKAGARHWVGAEPSLQGRM